MKESRPERDHRTTQDFYDRISGVYDLISDASEKRARETGERALQLRPGERVLEIGFGTGNSLVNSAKAVGDSGRVCGVDISDGMCRIAQEKLERAGLLHRVRLEVADGEALPWDTSTFDAVFLSFTLELFSPESLPHVLSEIRRVLTGSGRIVVVSMARVRSGEHESFIEKTYRWMHRHFPHIVDCRPINSAHFLTKAGFAVRDEDRVYMWTMPVDIVVAAPNGQECQAARTGYGTGRS